MGKLRLGSRIFSTHDRSQVRPIRPVTDGAKGGKETASRKAGTQIGRGRALHYGDEAGGWPADRSALLRRWAESTEIG